MIRTETISLDGATKRANFSGVTGFMCHKKGGASVMPLLAAVLHNGEDAEAGERDLVVQEGVWYGPELGFNLVRLTTSDGAAMDVYVTTATRAGDLVLPR